MVKSLESQGLSCLISPSHKRPAIWHSTDCVVQSCLAYSTGPKIVFKEKKKVLEINNAWGCFCFLFLCVCVCVCVCIHFPPNYQKRALGDQIRGSTLSQPQRNNVHRIHGHKQELVSLQSMQVPQGRDTQLLVSIKCLCFSDKAFRVKRVKIGKTRQKCRLALALLESHSGEL